ncbi:MFS transporter-like protein, partial [Plectosphaerella plurivora]
MASINDRDDAIHAGEESPLLGPRPEGDDNRKPAAARSASRIAATMLCFAVLGLFTSTTGVLLPHLEHDYNLSDSQASLIFLAVPVPYLLAAQSNGLIHSKLGRRGIAILGPLAHLAGSVGASQRPPFWGFLVCFAALAFGCGLVDASWASWAAAQESPNFTSGLLHGAFSVGAAAGPAIASLVMSTETGSWFVWYYYLAGASLVELTVLAWAFRSDDAKKYHELDSSQPEVIKLEGRGISEVVKYRAVWMCAAYLLMYVGTESAISGWIVLFMTRARHVRPALANLCSTGFWAGMAVGRLILGPVTERVGIRRAVPVYLIITMLTGVVFALVKNTAVSILLLATIGAFCGPLFPSSIVFLASAIPSSIHVAAVSFVSSVGQVGGAGLPALIGIISEAVGIRAFQTVIMAQLAITLVLWLLFTHQKPKALSSDAASSTAGLLTSG